MHLKSSGQSLKRTLFARVSEHLQLDMYILREDQACSNETTLRFTEVIGTLLLPSLSHTQHECSQGDFDVLPQKNRV